MNENPTFTVTVRGQQVTFTSAFATLAEAYKVLAAQGNPSSFALSLLEKARARQLSPLQVAWVHKLATDLQPVASLNLKPIVDMMERAHAAQKRAPRITLACNTPVTGKLVLKLCVADTDARGSVSITDGGAYPNAIFYGRVSPDGSVTKRMPWQSAVEVEQLLRRLAADPAAVAAQHGVATGQCCFCGTALSTAESRSVGYGPICASKFGLPWGDTSLADAADAEAKQALQPHPEQEKFDRWCQRRLGQSVADAADAEAKQALSEPAGHLPSCGSVLFPGDVPCDCEPERRTNSMDGAADDYRSRGTSRHWTGD